MGINMYMKDFDRLKAKIYHKLRMLYINRFQTATRRLNLYRCYRRYRAVRGRSGKSGENKVYLTRIVNPTAGIGDQLASWITGYYYAGIFGADYAYSPLFPAKWNYFLGFYMSETTVGELRKKGYKKVWLPFFDENNPDEIRLVKNIIDTYRGEKVIFYLEVNQVYTEQYSVRQELSKKFNQAPARMDEELIYDRDKINIALHVRRGDIVEGQLTDNPSLTFRWLTNSYYVNVLDRVLQICGNRKTEIYFFSQGQKEDFPEFVKYKGIHWCLDMSAQRSFLHMVRADVLITGKSSFSYKPALLSDSIRICPGNFWHGYPDDPKWILADEDGSIDRDGVKKIEEYIFKI